ncbi:unnamed protein product [Thelazia callipaeda]|uniref:Peptidase_M13_N domain-containing protein n=1 Tax=Thelazia callipaeda TaxID=103827 RepID=A0A0N5CS77_THECL|nr:unnamed protein product [Thelazia callipaeda]
MLTRLKWSKQIKQLIDTFRKIANWPLLEENWNECVFNISEALALVTNTFKSSVLFHIDQPSLGLGFGSRDYYLDQTKFSDHLKAYEKYQLNTLSLILDGANVSYNRSQLKSDVHDTISFEINIAKVVDLDHDCFW